MSWHADVEKNHVPRKSCYKFETQKWNEYFSFIYFSQSINEKGLIYIFFLNLRFLKKNPEDIELLTEDT